MVLASQMTQFKAFLEYLEERCSKIDFVLICNNKLWTSPISLKLSIYPCVNTLIKYPIKNKTKTRVVFGFLAVIPQHMEINNSKCLIKAIKS